MGAGLVKRKQLIGGWQKPKKQQEKAQQEKAEEKAPDGKSAFCRN